ncbi:uncharacterized protein, partial [Phyllobates terribilis]|uniref:uncharacterized protein n=1 Tax=Phyllobates terribilis TaxID=111132 RepID=UPI003CCB2934
HKIDQYVLANNIEINVVSEKSMIKKRYLFHTEEMLRNNPNMCEFSAPSFDVRQKMLATQIPNLGKEAAIKAIEEWGQDKSKITHLIFCNTGCVQTPGSDFQLTKLMGLNPTVKRFMINMQGCFAGGTTLRLAKDLAENNKGARVLVVCSESIVFCFRGPKEGHIDSLISQMLFSDGASALVVGSDPVEILEERPIFQILSASQTIISETEGAVSLDVQEAGLLVHLAKEVPAKIADKIEGILMDAFEPLGISDWNSIFWAAHPGGKAILDKIEKNLSLEKDKLRASRNVLSEYGNMISACVFFILDDIRRKSIHDSLGTTGEGHEWGVLLGFGPGLTVETVVLQSVPL